MSMTVYPTFPLIESLSKCQSDFYEDASQNQTIGEFVKTNFLGRVISLGISFILHAEAVCRAVMVCFLSIKKSFSQSTDELLAKQKADCFFAYSQSWRSFIAVFYLGILKTNIVTPEPPVQVQQIQVVVNEQPLAASQVEANPQQQPIQPPDVSREPLPVAPVAAQGGVFAENPDLSVGGVLLLALEQDNNDLRDWNGFVNVIQAERLVHNDDSLGDFPDEIIESNNDFREDPVSEESFEEVDNEAEEGNFSNDEWVDLALTPKDPGYFAAFIRTGRLELSVGPQAPASPRDNVSE